MAPHMEDDRGRVISGTRHAKNDRKGHLTALWNIFYTGHGIGLLKEIGDKHGDPCFTSIQNVTEMRVKLFDMLHPEILEEILEELD